MAAALAAVNSDGQTVTIPERQKITSPQKGGIFLEIGLLYFFVALLIGIIFFECTKTGQKITDYIIKKIMK